MLRLVFWSWKGGAGGQRREAFIYYPKRLSNRGQRLLTRMVRALVLSNMSDGLSYVDYNGGGPNRMYAVVHGIVYACVCHDGLACALAGSPTHSEAQIVLEPRRRSTTFAGSRPNMQAYNSCAAYAC